MRYLRHDFYYNFVNASGTKDKEQILTDEIAKLIVINPDIVRDALRTHGVTVSKTVGNVRLAEKVGNNLKDRKFREKIAKLILILNIRDENNQYVDTLYNADGKKQGWLRKLFSKGKQFYDENKDQIDELNNSLGDVYGGKGGGTNKAATENLKDTVNSYQQWGKGGLYQGDISEKKTNYMPYIVGGAIALTLVGFTIYRLKK